MIVEGKGDLLAAGVDALVNTVNCVGVMGKGIALQFKRRYPEVFKEYERACKQNNVTIGKMLVVPTGELTGPRYVINFPTKKHWRSPSRLRYIQDGLQDLHRVAGELGVSSIAVPPLGSGNGGLDWFDVEPLIRAEFESDTALTVVLFSPSAGTRAIAAEASPRVTPFKALILDLIGVYAAQRQASEPWEDPGGISHLEIQKLVYFVKIVDSNLRVDFVQGRYGPYSDAVRHALQDMEGSLIVGLGDGSGRTLDLEPIRLTTQGGVALRSFLDSDPQARRVTETSARVMRLIEGFEGSYGLELLASTHWVASRSPALRGEQAAREVRGWTKRKGRIFTDQHVGSALDHLVAAQS